MVGLWFGNQNFGPERRCYLSIISNGFEDYVQLLKMEWFIFSARDFDHQTSRLLRIFKNSYLKNYQLCSKTRRDLFCGYWTERYRKNWFDVKKSIFVICLKNIGFIVQGHLPNTIAQTLAEGPGQGSKGAWHPLTDEGLPCVRINYKFPRRHMTYDFLAVGPLQGSVSCIIRGTCEIYIERWTLCVSLGLHRSRRGGRVCIFIDSAARPTTSQSLKTGSPMPFQLLGARLLTLARGCSDRPRFGMHFGFWSEFFDIFFCKNVVRRLASMCLSGIMR